MNELFKVTVGTQVFNGWEKVAFTRSMLSLAATFSLEVSDRWVAESREWVFNPGDSIKLHIDKDIQLTGYIDEVNIEKTESNHIIKLTGRDKTSDLIDSSAFLKKASFTDTDLFSLAKKLIKDFDIGLIEIALVEDKKFDITFEVGETPFNILNRKCRELGCLLNSNRFGELVITNASTIKTKTRLVMGQNIKKAQYSQNNTDRHSIYSVVGQSKTKGTGWARKEIIKHVSGFEVDTDIRFRPIVIQADQNTSADNCIKQAQWEKNTRIGRSRVLDVTVQGWYQTAVKELWQINTMVFVDIPDFFLKEDLIIVDTTFNKSNLGTETILKLMPKEAFATV